MQPRPRASDPALSPRPRSTDPTGAATQATAGQGPYYSQAQHPPAQYPPAQYEQYAHTQPPQAPATSGYAQPNQAAPTRSGQAPPQPLTQDPWAIAPPPRTGLATAQVDPATQGRSPQPTLGSEQHYAQASYDPSSYDRPDNAPPHYGRPGHDQPGYDQPGYDQPGYEQPGYGPLGPGQSTPLEGHSPTSTISVAQARRLAQLHSQTQQRQGGYGARTYHAGDGSPGHFAEQQFEEQPGAIPPGHGPQATRDPFAPTIARGYTGMNSAGPIGAGGGAPSVPPLDHPPPHRRQAQTQAHRPGSPGRSQVEAPQRPSRKPRYLEEDDDFVPQFQPRQGGNGAGGDSYGSWRSHRPGLTLPSFQWQNLPLGEAKFWSVIGSVVFAAVMLNILATSPVISSIVKERNRQCQEVVQPSSVLSREQLTRLLTVPERSPKAEIRNIISEPYCRMPGIKIRAGVNAVREAYPLDFDPETWIVVLYEGDEYAGYRFNAR